MDGNRRWAKQNGCETKKGHVSGFERFYQALEWCLDLGVEMVTVYAWSIENFKRSKEEVDYLMEMAIEKVNYLLSRFDIIEKHSVCVKVLGDFKLLPLELQKAFAKIINSTKHNNKVTLNVCFSYTAQNEMCNSINRLAQGVQDKFINHSDVTENLFEKCLYLQRPVDLLIRTSGEERFSDFLLWQNTFACVVFLDVLWPDFSAWHLYWAIILYQKNYPILLKRREGHIKYRSQIDQNNGDDEREGRSEKYLNHLHDSQSHLIAKLLST
jgi:ditrans,polycis-polyprenyl diphosphate synthase